GPFWMVDDEPELVSATVGMLSAVVGATQIRGSTDPREVAGWIERERPTALITDVRMPHVNGLELVQRLHQKWGPVPVVVMTAFPTAQVDQEARAGRFAYLPKPFTFQALRETLQRICAQPAPSAFSGAIAVSMLGEVVQLYGLANRTGTLLVNSDVGTGEVGFDSGRVVDARAGDKQGVEAFNEILSWTSGGFSWSPSSPVQRSITTGLSELLIDAYRIRDEKNAGVESSTDDDDMGLSAFDELENVTPRERPADNNVRDNLSRLERVDGFLGAALYDMDAGVCVSSVDKGAGQMERAVEGHVELLQAKRRTISKLNLDDDLEDIVITLGRQYHLLRLCRRRPQLFFFLTLDRTKANLAMARYLLSDVERDIVL
ncbi:MAG: response regulator, partial [Archangium sp.]